MFSTRRMACTFIGGGVGTTYTPLTRIPNMSPNTLVTGATKLLSAYVIVQITVGIQLGVGIAWAFIVHGIPIPVITAVLTPIGLLLVAIQLPIAMRIFNNSRAGSQATPQ